MKLIALFPILGIFLSSPVGSAPAPPEPDVVAASTQSRDSFYEVRGATADAVFSSIGRRKLGNTPGRSASGLTESKLSYSIESVSGSNKPCRVLSLSLDLDIKVTLPRHANPGVLDPDARRNWEIYATAVEAHEYRHVEIELRGLEELAERLRRSLSEGRITAPGKTSCANYVNELLQQQRVLTKSRHASFHEEAAQEVRDLQTMARMRLDNLDSAMRQDQATVAEFDQLIRSVRLTFDETNATIPLATPYQAAERQAAARAIAEELNAAIDQRNLLAEDLRSQLTERERLVEDLHWIR